MHVRVDADSVFLERDDHDEIRRLAADAGERDEFLNGLRNLVIELPFHEGPEFFQMFRFRMIKTHGIDEFLDFLFR